MNWRTCPAFDTGSTALAYTLRPSGLTTIPNGWRGNVTDGGDFGLSVPSEWTLYWVIRPGWGNKPTKSATYTLRPSGLTVMPTASSAAGTVNGVFGVSVPSAPTVYCATEGTSLTIVVT